MAEEANTGIKTKILNQEHPTRSQELLDMYRTLYDGGTDWREHIKQWLPQHHEEPPDVYKDRKVRSSYYNYAGGILGIVIGYLFSVPPQVEGPAKDSLADILSDVDHQGSPWARFWRRRFADALVGQHAYAWINAHAIPDGVEVKSKADEDMLGIGDSSLFLVGLSGEDVIDWGEDEHGNLSWLIYRVVDKERTEITDSRKTVWRWTYIDCDVIRRWKWFDENGKKEEPGPDDFAVESAPIEHKMGMCPVIRLTLPKGLWALNMIYEPAIDLFRSRNDLTWALHKSAHALMVVNRKWEGNAPTVGHGYYLELKPDESVSYAEPTGRNFRILQQDVKDKKEELFRVVQQMAMGVDSDASRARMSGESKEKDWQATDVMMAEYADLLLSAMSDTILRILKIRKSDNIFTVTGLDSWKTESINNFLIAASMSMEAKVLSPTFRKLVAKRQASRLLQDEVSEDEMNTVLTEIDNSDPDLALMWLPPAAAPETPADDHDNDGVPDNMKALDEDADG